MKRSSAVALLLAAAFPVVAAVPSFELDAVPVSDVVRLVYLQAYPLQQYVADPILLQDHRLVSFRERGKTDADFRGFWSDFLRGLGYQLDSKAGVDVIRPLPVDHKLSLIEDPGIEVFQYRPRYRDGSYLVEMLSPLFTGKFLSQRKMNIDAPKTPSAAPSGAGQGVAGGSGQSTAVAPPGSLLDQANRKQDLLIFAGSSREVSALKKLLVDVDVDAGQVVVQAALYEVQTSDRSSSALELAASLLNGKFSVQLGAASASDNFLSIKLGGVSGIMQVLDSRRPWGRTCLFSVL